MFADSFCESPWGNSSRRGWTTFASFVAQSIGLSILLLLPLLYTEGLPGIQLIAPIVAPAPPPGPPAPIPRQSARRPSLSNMIGVDLLEPRNIPRYVARIVEDTAPPPLEPSGNGVIGGSNTRGIPNGVLNSILNATTAVASPPPKPATRPIRISTIMEGNLIQRVQPEYPAVAKAARIQGRVLLRAVITRQGRIENLTVVDGPPMLVKAAIAAVSQWRYRPYMLNGEPYEVETQVTVNFVLN